MHRANTSVPIKDKAFDTLEDSISEKKIKELKQSLNDLKCEKKRLIRQIYRCEHPINYFVLGKKTPPQELWKEAALEDNLTKKQFCHKWNLDRHQFCLWLSGLNPSPQACEIAVGNYLTHRKKDHDETSQLLDCRTYLMHNGVVFLVRKELVHSVRKELVLKMQ